MIKKPNDPNGNAHRVIAFLTRDELDFIDKIGKDALFSAGTKLSRSKIISAIVNVIRRIRMDGCGLSSKKELEIRIFKAIKNISKIYNKLQKTERQELKGEKNGNDI